MSAWQRDGGGFYRESRAGQLLGLVRRPRSGLNLELKPYGLAGMAQEREEGAPPGRQRRRGRPGADLKWEVKPGLVLDVTARPDFAQVEADDEQVNQKHEFFLENAGTFDFGFRGFGEPSPLLLFFSRRINEDEESGLLSLAMKTKTGTRARTGGRPWHRRRQGPCRGMKAVHVSRPFGMALASSPL